MAETYCCRFHKVYVILLALAAWSLVSHFFVDVLPFPQTPDITVAAQTDLSNRLNNQEMGHATGLHGGFMLAEMPTFASPEMCSHTGENSASPGMVWTPPTPSQPPISR
ncbi:MAG: hypothetical protein Fur0022_00300 [Anaerolineales bacterium]